MKNILTLKKFCLVVAIVGLLHTIVDAEVREIKLENSDTGLSKVHFGKEVMSKDGYSLDVIIKCLADQKFIAADGNPFELVAVDSVYVGLTGEATRMISYYGVVTYYEALDWCNDYDLHFLDIYISRGDLGIFMASYSRHVDKKISLNKTEVDVDGYGTMVPINYKK